jgi:hypothetical protein
VEGMAAILPIILLWVAHHLAAAPTICSAVNKTVQELMDEKQKHIALIKQNLVAAHNWIKVQADKNCTDKEF